MSLAVVGADFPNKRGPTRRFEIAICQPGEPVELRPEPRNPHDPRAIAVFSDRGIQLGYVRAERAPLVRTLMSRGVLHAIFQQMDDWGCTIRIGSGGEVPTLPDSADRDAAEWPPVDTSDVDWGA